MKTLIQEQYELRHASIITAEMLETTTADLRFFRVNLNGKFDNLHSILLNHKMVNHQAGYEVYTPFYIFNSKKSILVDRGFIPQGDDIEPIFGEQTIEGILSTPKIDLEALSQKLHQSLYPYVVLQNQKEIPPLGMPPEKHIAYAIQWFMLAIVFLMGFIILNIRKK